MINIQRQPREWTMYPEAMDIQMMVTGLPKISSALARDRSDRTNQRLRRTSIEGKTAPSITPNRKRTNMSQWMFLTMPVAVARAPQKSRDQKISWRALRMEAYTPGIWKKK